MRIYRVQFCLWFLLWGTTFYSVSRADEEVDFFESKIRPVLIEHCYQCHSQEYGLSKGGLALDSREGIRRGGESGAAVVPHQPQDSLLLEAIRYESFEMPPKTRLSAEVIANFEKWISNGAVDPRDAVKVPVQQREKAEIDWDQERQFWAFTPPQPADTNPGEHRIDRLIAARYDEHNLHSVPPADPRTLLRRIFFDLTGLPPTATEVEEFTAAVQVDKAQAVQAVVDRLLASPRYGEKWAALWLDLSRYAEDQAHIVGNNKELFFPNAYRYRDWVISALNSDLPYDDFIRLQLAADLVTPDDPSDDVALGFIGLGPKYYRRNSPEVMADEWEDRVDVVSRGLLGLTVACARCHDHKYDPIPTEDYYALAGVFASTEMWNRPLTDEVEAQKNGHAKQPEESLHVIRDQNIRDLNVLIRGDVNSHGEIVPRRFLQILCASTPEPFTDGSGRRELADQIATRENPLTARVIVNRIWAAYFGNPIVGTPSNFGELGERPTHPQLLDDLAVGLMENDWSLKWLHREIVTSQTYQLSSHTNRELAAADEANRWLARMNRRRLTVEQWRDALLQVAGRLDEQIGGPSIIPDEPANGRRTVYSERSRFQLNSMLALFDFPDPNAHAARRAETTTPLQKLFVLNHPWMLTMCAAVADRCRSENDDLRVQIESVYQLLFQRLPSQDELRLGERYIAHADLDSFVQILVASNEFLILD